MGSSQQTSFEFLISRSTEEDAPVLTPPYDKMHPRNR